MRLLSLVPRPKEDEDEEEEEEEEEEPDFSCLYMCKSFTYKTADLHTPVTTDVCLLYMRLKNQLPTTEEGAFMLENLP